MALAGHQPMRLLYSLQIVRSLAQAPDADSPPFRDHEAKLFVRFKNEQFKKLKKCQLQILLYNQGLFADLADKGLIQQAEYFQRPNFPGQASNPVTWHPSSFNQTSPQDLTMVRMAASMDDDGLRAFFKALRISDLRKEMT